MLTSALRSGGLSTTSVAEATPSRSPGVSSTAFRAQSPNLRFASLMDMDFAVSCPLVRRWRLISGFCSSTRTFVPCFLQTPPRSGSPCIITRPYLHQVGQRTFTSKLLSMPSTQRSRWCGGRYRVSAVTHLRRIMLEELQRRHYSEATARYYIRAVERFARHFHCSPDRLGPGHIREYQAQLFAKQKLSPGAVTNHLC